MNQIQNDQIFPMESELKYLSPTQKRLVLMMASDGCFTIKGHKNAQAMSVLVHRGIATRVAPSRFALTPQWAPIDPRLLRGEATKLARMELPPTPDPPRPKIRRPPARYSNESHEEMIDRILKTY